jgi:hypothetical protein
VTNEKPWSPDKGGQQQLAVSRVEWWLLGDEDFLCWTF